MKILIRQADLDQDLDLIRETHNANRDQPADARRFQWAYLGNPDGRAVAWFAVDEQSGQVAGVAAVHPRRVRLGCGHEVRAWNCGDLSVHQRFRRLGIGRTLRGMARQAVDLGDPAFLYAHPNRVAARVHLATGHQVLGRMVRYIRPLRISGLGSLDALTSTALCCAGTDWLVHSTLEFEWLRAGSLPDELTELYDQVARRLGTSVVRDRAYLEWRFMRNPVEQTELLIARSRNHVQGYLAYALRDGYAVAKDWLAVDRTVWNELFAGWIREMRRRDLAWVSLMALSTHPDLPALRSFGFVRRPGVTTAIVHASPSYRASVATPEAWYMTAGDRDG